MPDLAHTTVNPIPNPIVSNETLPDPMITDDLQVVTVLRVDGGLRGHFQIVTNALSPFAVSDLDDLIVCDCSAGAVTLNLPPVLPLTGLYIKIKKSDQTRNAVVLDGFNAETIDGLQVRSLSVPYGSITLFCDGTQWLIV